jgi:hypothetical protein
LDLNVYGSDSLSCFCDCYDTTCMGCNFLMDNALNSMYATVFKPIYSVSGSSFCNNDNALYGCYVNIQGIPPWFWTLSVIYVCIVML